MQAVSTPHFHVLMNRNAEQTDSPVLISGIVGEFVWDIDPLIDLG
jgi:hypothetical protein